MPGEGFFRRWARLKSGDTPAPQAGRMPPGAPAGAVLDPAIDLPPLAQDTLHPPVAPAPIRTGPQRPPPTMEDVALLGPDSDFSAFVTHGVDKAVQRLAMKKLFSDPHFRVRDGLDVYIDDYTRPDPVSAAMLAQLQHAKRSLARAVDEEPPLPGELRPGAGAGGGMRPDGGAASGSDAPCGSATGTNGAPGGSVPGANDAPEGDEPGTHNKPGGEAPPPPEGDA